MTTPIPDVAVEAAARALSPNPAHWRQFMGNARTALTAARPHMEDETLRAIADELSTSFGWLDTDDADRASRWLRNRAATIAERTNDEPA